jgi:hypothetical protein
MNTPTDRLREQIGAAHRAYELSRHIAPRDRFPRRQTGIG